MHGVDPIHMIEAAPADDLKLSARFKSYCLFTPRVAFVADAGQRAVWAPKTFQKGLSCGFLAVDPWVTQEVYGNREC